MTDGTNLQGKIAIVTGASTGIGREIALALSASGAHVCLIGRSVSAMQRLQQQNMRVGSFEVHRADLRCLDDIDEVVDRIEEKHGEVDILLNVAGVWHDEERAFYGFELTDIAPAEIADVLGVGIKGALFLTRRILRGMKLKHGGKIVFVSCGFSGPQEAAGWIHYYVANKAIEALAQGLAAECRPYNVQVNCIAPWFVATEAVQKFFPDKFDKALSTSEVAKTALLLVSEQSDNITGQVTELRSHEDY